MNKPEMDAPKPEREPPRDREGDSALVDAREAARLCGVSESMLYKLNAAGKMPTPVRLGSLMRWKRRDLLEWIDKGCPTGGPGATRR